VYFSVAYEHLLIFVNP